MRKLLLTLLAGACAASSAQAVTYAQYKIDVFGNATTVDLDFNVLGSYNFIQTYSVNLASTDTSPVTDGFYRVYFDSTSLSTMYFGGFFDDQVGASSTLPSVDGLPDLETGHLVGAGWSYGYTGPGTTGINTFYYGTVKFARTQFSDTSFGTSGLTESIQRFSAPEPATWATMVLGFGVAGFAMRRRQKVRVAFSSM